MKINYNLKRNGCGNKLVPNSLEITALKNIPVHNTDFLLLSDGPWVFSGFKFWQPLRQFSCSNAN